MNIQRIIQRSCTIALLVVFTCAGFATEAWGQAGASGNRLRKLDKDGDKAISKEEAGAEAWKLLGKLDANGDGKVTVDEQRQAAQARAGNAAENQGNAAEAVPDGEKHIYRTVKGTDLHLYVYKPEKRAAEASDPAIVFFHGGAWHGGSPGQFADQCEYFAKRGMVAITVEYRLSSKFPVKIDDCVEDAVAAMRWVRANAGKLGVDPDRIASSGGSAGGHLAACMAFADFPADGGGEEKKVSSKPNAMVLFNPAMALSPDPRMTDEARARAKGIASRIRGDAKAICPLAHAREKQPPCIMLFGTEDFLLAPAKHFQEDTVAAGNSCKLVTYEGKGHGFFNSKAGGSDSYFNKTLAEADQFLVGLGWLKKTEQP